MGVLTHICENQKAEKMVLVLSWLPLLAPFVLSLGPQPWDDVELLQGRFLLPTLFPYRHMQS